MKTVFKNAKIVNEGKIENGDLLVVNERIEKVGGIINEANAKEVIADGKLLIPGVIDDQVHFREPGLTHKANIQTEAAAAVAGGTTSFMEMPNTKPTTTTQIELQNKFNIAAKTSLANFSFFFGASNNNFDEVMKTDINNTCGVKIFMGSSTGNMLVDNEKILDKLFANVPCIIATHCEDEATVRNRIEIFKNKYGEKATAALHPQIRNVDACYLSSEKAIALAKKNNTRLHILHLSTAKELSLFRNDIPLAEKRITAEVCVHHLTFDSSEYETLGNNIKCNPAIKSKTDQDALWEALLDDRLDIIATDHAPHTKEEKARPYFEAPSGLPLVQHSLVQMLEHSKNGKINLEKVIEKMCHTPAICFDVKERGFLREGYFADLVLVDENKSWEVEKENIYAKCAWSPFEGRIFSNTIDQTWVNGNLVYSFKEGFNKSIMGKALQFDRI